jgi:hypothetical protein
MSKIYETKPFVADGVSEVEISPIEIDNKDKKNDKTIGVLYHNNAPAENYIMKIFRVSKTGKQMFMGFTFTDSFGQFTIPLSPKGAEYIIKIYSLKEELENLEINFD